MNRPSLAWIVSYLLVIVLVCSVSIGVLACCGTAPLAPAAGPALSAPAERPLNAPTSPQSGTPNR